MTGAEGLAWSGSVAAGTVLGGIASMHSRDAFRRIGWFAALPCLAYAALAGSLGPAWSAAAHIGAAATTMAMVRLAEAHV